MWRRRRTLKWRVYKPKNGKGCWKPPERNDWKRDMAQALPQSPQKELTLLTRSCQTPVLQDWGTMNSCWWKPPSLCQYEVEDVYNVCTSWLGQKKPEWYCRHPSFLKSSVGTHGCLTGEAFLTLMAFPGHLVPLCSWEKVVLASCLQSQGFSNWKTPRSHELQINSTFF